MCSTLNLPHNEDMTTRTQYLNRTISDALNQYRIQRGAAGHQITQFLEQWHREPIVKWRQYVNHPDLGDLNFDEDDLVRFAVALNAHLALRDACILMGMHDVDEHDVVMLVTNPLNRKSTTLVHDRLTNVFRDPGDKPEADRTRRTLYMFEKLASCLPDNYTAPIYAVEAYLLWWLGDYEASHCANSHALQLDPQYPLARITMNTLQYHIMPAWCAGKQKLRE